MGVSGCGKTTVGKLLAENLGMDYYDADDFHPESNIDKMKNEIPLTDEDRLPWLVTLANQMETWEAGGGAILSCSALKEKYRQILALKVKNITWVHLSGSFDLIKSRMESRNKHYMKSYLLQSQFDALEIPNYGIQVAITLSPQEIVNNILSKLKSMNKSVFGVIGLGVMGKSISLNLAEKGHIISVYNRTEEGEAEIVNNFIASNNSFENLHGFTSLAEFIQSLERPRKILLMIKAGSIVDQVIEMLLPLLSEEDIIIDGGNSHYKDTNRRYQYLEKNKIQFIGAGVSGGEEGARKGPSIMPGGSKSSYNIVAPILESIAAKDSQGKPCCAYIGPEGAGHFIKMVHNGMEYAEMQLLAELYALLSKSMNYQEISNLFLSWNKGDLSSYLLEITAEILCKKEGDHYLLDLILDKAGNKGTGSWSSKAAFDLGIPTTMMSSAVFARYISSFKEKRKELSKLREKKTDSNTLPNIDSLKNAYQFARIINHHQGFDLMKQASNIYGWNLPLAEIARIWTNGCIIRSSFMTASIAIFQEHDELLNHKDIFTSLNANENAMSEILGYGLSKRVALPTLWSAYNYWVAMTTEILPANLIQAQRDYFGAHTYQRIDAPLDQFFHTNWL